MWGLIGLSGLVLFGTAANRLPVLHQLRLVGAPKPQVILKVNGSKELVVRLPRAKAGEPPEARTAQIEVGVHNPSSLERIDRALINFLVPIAERVVPPLRRRL
jgi:hypothetical protein